MIGAIVIGSGEGAAAPAATSADATSPTRQTEAPLSPDPMPVAPLVLAGVAGLLVGLFAGRVRPRTTR